MNPKPGDVNPTISVIMPVYNVAPYIYRAVSSVLNQTFADFEFIVIDDGSTDKTAEIIRSFQDSRIRLYERCREGTVYQLNYGLRKARGKYIARQDGDDFSMPNRFERQVRFLETCPDYGVVSSAMRLIDEENRDLGVLRYPEAPDVEKLMEKCCISHPASMWHKEVNDRVGGYDETFNKNCCEDYDFWLRVIECYKIRVLNKTLYVKREHSQSSISKTRWTYVPVYDELARKKARQRHDQPPGRKEGTLQSCR